MLSAPWRLAVAWPPVQVCAVPLQARAYAAQPPELPADCCGDGCPRCVWDVYYDELDAYERSRNAASVEGSPPALLDVTRHFSTPNVESVDAFYAARGVQNVGVSSIRALTPADPHVVEVVLNVAEAGWAYEQGDHILIHAPNPQNLVDQLVRRLGYTSDSRMEIQCLDPAHAPALSWLPSQYVTMEHLFLHYVDVTSSNTLRNSRMLQLLLECAQDEADRQALKACVEDTSLLPPKCTVSLLALLEHFGSCKPDLGRLLQHLRPLVPRCFSAASSPSAAPDTLTVWCSVDGDIHSAWARGCEDHVAGGLCTSWLHSKLPAAEGLSLPVSRPKNLQRVYVPPANTQTPLILCATGVGIAPLAAMLQHRAVVAKSNPGSLGPCILLYGCRNRSAALLNDQLQKWKQEGVVSAVHMAYSQPHSGTGGQYVWQLMLGMPSELVHLMQDGAHFYVCGSPAMQADVAKTWNEIAVQEGSKHANAVEWWKLQGQYQTESWE